MKALKAFFVALLRAAIVSITVFIAIHLAYICGVISFKGVVMTRMSLAIIFFVAVFVKNIFYTVIWYAVIFIVNSLIWGMLSSFSDEVMEKIAWDALMSYLVCLCSFFAFKKFSIRTDKVKFNDEEYVVQQDRINQCDE